MTLANVYLDLENDLEIIPVHNKIDVAAASLSRVAAKIETAIGLDTNNIIYDSAKNSIRITDILEHIIANAPLPRQSRRVGC